MRVIFSFVLEGEMLGPLHPFPPRTMVEAIRTTWRTLREWVPSLLAMLSPLQGHRSRQSDCWEHEPGGSESQAQSRRSESNPQLLLALLWTGIMYRISQWLSDFYSKISFNSVPPSQIQCEDLMNPEMQSTWICARPTTNTQHIFDCPRLLFNCVTGGSCDRAPKSAIGTTPPLALCRGGHGAWSYLLLPEVKREAFSWFWGGKHKETTAISILPMFGVVGTDQKDAQLTSFSLIKCP